MGFPKPSISNQYLKDHVGLLLGSFKHWTGRVIIEEMKSLEQQARELYYAPFAVASHDTSEDPILNYGNQTALTLWEVSWEDFTSMPSRQTAEPMTQEERKHLLAEVTAHGFIDHYQGVRISAMWQVNTVGKQRCFENGGLSSTFPKIFEIFDWVWDYENGKKMTRAKAQSVKSEQKAVSS